MRVAAPKGEGKTTLVDVLAIEAGAARRKLVDFIKETEQQAAQLRISSRRRLPHQVRMEYLELQKRMDDLLARSREELAEFDRTTMPGAAPAEGAS